MNKSIYTYTYACVRLLDFFYSQSLALKSEETNQCLILFKKTDHQFSRSFLSDIGVLFQRSMDTYQLLGSQQYIIIIFIFLATCLLALLHERRVC